MDFQLSLTTNAELIELLSDKNMHIPFKETSCDTFWIYIKTEYQHLM